MTKPFEVTGTKKRDRVGSSLERSFETFWKIIDGPELEPEYKFLDNRKFRFDFAHPQAKIAIEIEGAVYANGRHTRGAGYTLDCEKYNLAQLAGWRVFRLTSEMLLNPTKNLCPIRDFILSNNK